MRALIIPEILRACAMPSLPASPASRPRTDRDTPAATRSASAAEHDATLLVAALGEIEARRAALEWLLEADLLHQCLV